MPAETWYTLKITKPDGSSEKLVTDTNLAHIQAFANAVEKTALFCLGRETAPADTVTVEIVGKQSRDWDAPDFDLVETPEPEEFILGRTRNTDEPVTW